MEEAISHLLENDEDEILKLESILRPKFYHQQFWKASVRSTSSDRSMQACRPTTVLPSVVEKNAAGSVLVSMGNTKVMAGTTLMVGTPPPSAPDRGELELSLHVGPVCSPRYNVYSRVVDNGRPERYDDFKAIEGRLVRVLKAAHYDVKQLCIQEGRHAWKIRIHVTVLNHDGNLFDASLLAATHALMDTVLPPTTLIQDEYGREVVAIVDDAEEDTSMGGGRARPFRWTSAPVPLTIGLFSLSDDDDNKGDKRGKVYCMMVDPTVEEEKVMDGIITVVVSIDPNKSEDREAFLQNSKIMFLNVMGGKIRVKTEDIEACTILCKNRALDMLPVIKQFMKE